MTTLYLLRHAATEANLARPYRLQGRRLDMPLADLGIRQAELTRDYLALHPLDRVVSSPLQRARQTAEIIAAPHGLSVELEDPLVECDVGVWEGLSWDTIRQQDPLAWQRFEEDPASYPYPGGESFSQVWHRISQFLDHLMERRQGETILVVSHHIVCRVYLAGLLGMPLAKAKLVKLDNCGLSVVRRHPGGTAVATLNSAFHLLGLGAAA
jgi:broad specificity phosphatase PhoE